MNSNRKNKNNTDNTATGVVAVDGNSVCADTSSSRHHTDKQLVRERFEASFGRYNRLAHVQQRICAELATLLQELKRAGQGSKIKRVMEIGIGTGFLTSRLVTIWPEAEWFLNDIATSAGKYVAKYVAGADVDWLWGDAEEIGFPGDLDLVVSASTVQWFDDMPAFVAKVTGAISRGGWLAITTFGPDNFCEIRATTGEGLDYLSKKELEEMLLRTGYRILHSQEKTERLTFSNPVEVLHHIKATGVNSIRKARWGRQQLSQFSADYVRSFSTGDGMVGLTYHPIIIVAEKI